MFGKYAVIAAFLLILTVPGQPSAGGPVIRIYVEPFGNKSGGGLRDETIKLLRNQKELIVVTSAADADRVLTGTNETYIKGYLARNPRLRYRNSDSRPVFGGYVSIELKDKQDETVWSYLVTPRRFGNEDINKNLADQIVEKLTQFLASAPAKGT